MKIVFFNDQVKSTFVIKTHFNETPRRYEVHLFRVIIMNEYRSIHIDIKNVITFISFKMKNVYNSQH